MGFDYCMHLPEFNGYQKNFTVIENSGRKWLLTTGLSVINLSYITERF